METQSATYSEVQKKVSAANRSSRSKSRRELHGRLFPKASIRTFAIKHGAKRLASTESNGVYELIDMKLYTIIETVIHDAIVFTKSAGQTTIKESDVIKAIERLGGSVIGLGSEESRRKLKN